MAVDRTVPTSATVGAVSGDDYMDAVSDEIGALWDRSANRLTSIGGTANAITATLTPALTGSVVAGMVFYFVPTANNTGSATLALNGGSAITIKTDAGDAIGANVLVSGRLAMVYFDGTDFRLFGSSNIQIVRQRQDFTASGTWTKPSGINDSASVLIEVWAGGGGGNSVTIYGGGGGGGGYDTKRYLASELPGSMTVTVGAGGSPGNIGGNTSVTNGGTTYAIAYGGGAGGFVYSPSDFADGGGGGGEMSAGTSGVSDRDSNNYVPSAFGGAIGGGNGGTHSIQASSPNGGNALTTYGGGGGGRSGTGSTTAGNGGRAFLGGGGGGGNSFSGIDGTGGASKQGGNGGDSGVAGSPRGGGGGSNASGGRGEVRIWVVA